LVFEMGSTPNTGFGAALADRPPSFGKDATWI
jgi:putative alpha-1,2-mannosidase